MTIRKRNGGADASVNKPDDICTGDSPGSDDLVESNKLATPKTDYVLRTVSRTSLNAKKLWFIRLLQNYTRFIKSSLNQDRGLNILQWTLFLASQFYKKKSSVKSDGFMKLSSDVSFARYATRLLLLPTAIEAAMTDSWVIASQSYPAIFQFIGRALAISMVGYYPTEHVAYLHWMAPKWLAKGRSAAKMSALSCRCWLIFILAETVQCLLQWREVVKQKRIALEDNNDDQEKDDAELNLKLQITRNALFLLPCIEWSLPNWDRRPWLPGGCVGGLMWAESIVSMYQSIRNFNSSAS